MRVLVVESDALTALMLKEALEKHGHEAAILRDAVKALTVLQLPDLELDALLVKEPGGMALSRELRASHCANAGIPVFVALEMDSPATRSEAVKSGVTAFLSHPFDSDNVLDVLTAQVEGRLIPLDELPPPPVETPNFATAPARSVPLVAVPAAPAPVAPPAKSTFFKLPDSPSKAESRVVEPVAELVTTAPKPARDEMELIPLAPLPPMEDDLNALVPLQGEKLGTSIGSRRKIGELLIRSGIITVEQLEEALISQKRSHQKLGNILVGNGWATESQVSIAYSHQVEVPFVEIDQVGIVEELVARIPRELAVKHQFLPLVSDEEDIERGDPRIRVALSDPWNITAIDIVQQHTRSRVKPVLAETEALRRTIENVYLRTNSPDESIMKALSMSLEGAAPGEGFEDENADASDDGPIARFVGQVIVEGVRRRASDIHIEPYKKDFDVRLRVDGQMLVAHTMPRQSYNALVSRIKVMADMDIAEKRIPQDGRIALIIDERPIQFRVSSLPNQFGERIVMRILDKGATQKTLDQLDFSTTNIQHYQTLIKRPHGIILVTGPTGSGKTTTLYASLNAVKSPTSNIMTCEDPIEYEMDRISQSMVNPKAGLTFAAQLRAILRQDPDIVLVGEIRDGETAEIAFKAAMTGHLVLSTLHCNEAAGAAARLTDMGVEPFLIGSGMIGAVAQRLVRRLCPHCHTFGPPTMEEQALVDLLNGSPRPVEQLAKKVGCAKCNQLGTLGRVGVHEVMLMNEEITHHIMARAGTSVIQECAARTAGFVPMVEDGIDKAIRGVAFLEDVVKKVVSH